MILDPTTKVRSTRWPLWLPTPGNVIFTLIVVVGVLWAQSAGALALFVTPPPINILYQGRLADRAGAALGGDYKMTFALYSAAAGGAPLWSETYQDANKVKVNNGLFNVLLGSLAAIDQSVITANPELYLGITINDDTEMQPRVKLGSVPFATQAWTVPDGLITTAKLAPNAVTSDQIADGAIATSDLANQSVSMAKLGSDVKLSLPTGSVILWSGAIDQVPPDWQLCDGTNGMPNLRNRFVVGAGDAYPQRGEGGNDFVTLTPGQMPAHYHTGTTDIGGAHKHDIRRGGSGSSGTFVDTTTASYFWESEMLRTSGEHQHTFTTSTAGNSEPFDNRPAYYALAFICKK